MITFFIYHLSLPSYCALSIMFAWNCEDQEEIWQVTRLWTLLGSVPVMQVHRIATERELYIVQCLQLPWAYACRISLSKMASILSQWDFKHLEVVGTSVSCPPEFADIRGRIPQLKIETRKRITDRKEVQTAEQRTLRSPTKRQSLQYVKPQKEKVETVKVVLPKRSTEVIERNYRCSCEEESIVSSEDDNDDAEEIEFRELMDFFVKFSEGPRRELWKNLSVITKGFHGSRILTHDESIEVCTVCYICVLEENWQRSKRLTSITGFKS